MGPYNIVKKLVDIDDMVNTDRKPKTLKINALKKYVEIYKKFNGV